MKIKMSSERRDCVNFPTQTVDVNTTSDFGHLQPMCGCFELVPGSKLKIQHNSFVRFNSMPFPTFGRASQRTYHYFVPTSDIFHPYESMLAGKPHRGNLFTQVPGIPLNVLAYRLYVTSYYSLYKVTAKTTAENGDIDYTLEAAFDAVTYENVLASLRQHFYFTSVTQISVEDSEHTFTNARFNSAFVSEINNADYWYEFTFSNQRYVLCLRLSNFGRLLRKNLIGLGYKFIRSTEEVSILPIIAFYKAYFDYWVPQRNITWKDTNAYKLMEYIEYNNPSTSGWMSNVGNVFIGLLRDFAQSYYYQDPDYYTSQIPGVALSNTSINVPVLDSQGYQRFVGNNANQLPHLGGSNASYDGNVQNFQITGASLKALQFLTRFVNKNTTIGGRIDNYLKVHYGAVYKQADSSYFIGVDINDIEISEVMSNSDTTAVGGSELGAYAGQGKGFNQGKTFTLDTNGKSGFYINMSTVIPTTKPNQGIDNNLYHLKRFDFYLPGLDGMTLLPTRKTGLLATGVTSNVADVDLRLPFSNSTIYSEYKFRPQNLLNGDMSLPSTKDSYQGYQLDRMFTESYTEQTAEGKYTVHTDGDRVFNDLLNSTELRTIGKLRSYENYDRIFYNPGNLDEPVDDNILSHNVFMFDLYAPMLPYSESFDTDGFSDALSIEQN